MGTAKDSKREIDKLSALLVAAVTFPGAAVEFPVAAAEFPVAAVEFPVAAVEFIVAAAEFPVASSAGDGMSVTVALRKDPNLEALAKT